MGNRINDTILRITVDEEDKDSDPLRSDVLPFLEKRSGRFVDELTSLLFEDIGEDFEVDFLRRIREFHEVWMLITDRWRSPL